jgi:hypothetical protein
MRIINSMILSTAVLTAVALPPTLCAQAPAPAAPPAAESSLGLCEIERKVLQKQYESALQELFEAEKAVKNASTPEQKQVHEWTYVQRKQWVDQLKTQLAALEPDTQSKHWKWMAELNARTTLSGEEAKRIMEQEGQILSFDGLKELSPEAAKVLAGFRGKQLLLNGLTTLSPEPAAALAGFKGGVLTLDGLTTLSPEAATAIAGFKGGVLSLNGLTTLSPEAAMSLAWVNGKRLSLDGLRTLSPEAATAIAVFRGRVLTLDGLTTLSPEAATAIAGFKGGVLSLKGLTTLSPKAATALAAIQSKTLSLPGITAFDSPDSVAVAEALATRKGRLTLPNLKKISPKALSALLKKEDVRIPLVDTLELIAEPDGSPTGDFVIPKGFKERQEEIRRFKLGGDRGALTPEQVKKLVHAAPVEEDVAFFEKKYQRKITGVKPKGEYPDPDQFYSAIGRQLGIPELAWKAAAEKYGWKKDDGKTTLTILKGGPTSAGGEGCWDVLFIRCKSNPQTKKPDPATMEQVMVQVDYDGNSKVMWPIDGESMEMQPE